ncbi:MAG: PucR family transcriptional regulator, partial [Solirubrobacterales bacterium]|nr:PucR family transcriptional regulator [Solirubrobacterales bacterium]
MLQSPVDDGQLAAALRAALPELSDEIVETIAADVPDYARPLEGEFGRRVRIGVEVALQRFVDALERPASRDDGWRRVYVDLGRGEFRMGR